MPDLEVLAALEAAGIGHERLDHEPTAGNELVGDALDAASLGVRVEEREERVVDDKDQREAAVDAEVGEVADRDRDLSATRLRPQPRHHRRAGVDPADRDALAREREGEPAGADAELERRPTFGQIGEAPGGDVGVGRVRWQLVVEVGHAIAVGRRVVTFRALHESIASDAPGGGGRFAGTASFWSPALRWLPPHPKGGVW